MKIVLIVVGVLVLLKAMGEALGEDVQIGN
jgi:hypothetical protein